jgi:hypothetical protein
MTIDGSRCLRTRTAVVPLFGVVPRYTSTDVAVGVDAITDLFRLRTCWSARGLCSAVLLFWCAVNHQYRRAFTHTFSMFMMFAFTIGLYWWLFATGNIRLYLRWCWRSLHCHAFTFRLYSAGLPRFAFAFPRCCLWMNNSWNMVGEPFVNH